MISIIIPVLNEEREIKGILDSVSGYSGKKEVVVIDGGSTDRTEARRLAIVVNLSKINRLVMVSNSAFLLFSNILLTTCLESQDGV